MELTAYFDESGHDDKLLVMAGYVSTPEKWSRFSAECERIKSHFGIPYIHATELFNLKKTRIYGHLSQERRWQVAGALMTSIARHTEFSITITIIPRLYNSLTTAEWRNKNGTAYTACINGILICFSEFLPEGTTHALSIFLEDGHAHAREALQGLSDFKAFFDKPKSDIKMVGKCEDPPLQVVECGLLKKNMAPPLWAADLISYCTYNQVTRRDEFCNNIMQKIDAKVPGYGILLDKEKIQVMIQLAAEADAERRQWYVEMQDVVKHLSQFGIKPFKDRRGMGFDLSGMTAEQERQFFESVNKSENKRD